ncbi:hypothetical protein I6A84_33785 [Frankia sp. CNm7]|uniref:Uncharacterized protein n=1 Tax=Frankia nepalensis TaxID=1836974 RepID=A0A937RNK5_9ACTN|nr:hypothetical protein [Frankia nepalensis]MBL7512742.1 hypothetical protein [Frankia nepalensis]MBL7522926.1 hypothetical protein [Frankia nepalensis]MBL7632155.1 hypothetical protein [Frankia nepalensis]
MVRLWPAALVAVLFTGGAVGLALTTRLASSAPLLLVALRPTPSILLLVGASTPVGWTLLIAVPLRALVDVGYFGVARTNLRSLVALRPGGRRLVDALSRRTTERALLYFCLVNTNAAVDAALGGGDVPWRRFLRFLIPGTILSTTLYLLAARAVAPWARDVVTWLDSHATEGILLLLALGLLRLAVQAARNRLRRGRDAPAPGDSG